MATGFVDATGLFGLTSGAGTAARIGVTAGTAEATVLAGAAAGTTEFATEAINSSKGASSYSDSSCN